MARFRQTHESELAKLFTQVLRLCAEAGLVKVGVVALDGTKIKAHAGLASNRTAETIATEGSRMLTEAQATDAAEDRQDGPERCGDELPEALRDRRSRLARLQACQERLMQEAATATAQQQATIETRQADEAATGQQKRGRKPKAPEAATDRDAKANVTDPDSRIMKTQAGYVQGDNAQAVVTEAQILVAAEVTQEENASSNCTRCWNGRRRISRPLRLRTRLGRPWPMPAIAARLPCWRRIRQGPPS